MLSYLTLFALTVVSVSARYTVPVPISYEIEAQFQKQSGVRNMRFDPTNYLTYLAAIYAQCANLYNADGSRLIQRGRVPNATAYNTLLQYFDASLLQSNLVFMFWDIDSVDRQDAGTVDRDIRRMAGRANGAGAIQNLPNIDANTMRSYDRFGCSVETNCKQGTTPMMALVCIFGQSVQPKQTSGTGGDSQARPQTARPQPQTRPTPIGVRTTTTRPRPRPTQTTTTTASPDVIIAGGLYETFAEHSLEFYETFMRDYSPDFKSSITADIVPWEQKIVNGDLCKYENNPDSWTVDSVKDDFDTEAQPVIYGLSLSPRPTEADMRASPISDVAKSALRSATAQKLTTADLNLAGSIACSWALCPQNFVVGCVAWGAPEYDLPVEESRRRS